jgi:alpha-galactosidase
VEGTLQKAKQLGFEWAVLDDGWQTSEGDWKIDRSKFPRGAGDMLAFTRAVRAAGMKPRLWLSPLAVDPGTDLLHDHADMLLLNKDGAVENVTWWNAFTLCPAYAPTVGYYRDLVTRIIGDWGFAGLKLDGQHLNGVAPCYNPAHHHARPEESFEGLQDFWKALYDAALAANPEAVVELCPCGTSFAFHNMPYMNQTPASDPLSSWQVRHKGKTLKALLGSGASYAGDHVELSDRGNDFASTVGIGGVVASKFTWPVDTLHPIDALPPGGFVLTPEREIQWRKWVALYRAHMLPTGRYLGALYDIGFDKPEAHAIAKDNRLYYAFYAEQWDGPLELRGLGAGQYQVTDYVNDHPLGTVSHSANRIAARFEHSLLLEAKPL